MLQILIIILAIGILVWVPLVWKSRLRAYNILLWFVFCVYVVFIFYFTILSRTMIPERRVELRPFASYVSLCQNTAELIPYELNGLLAEFFLITTHPIQGIILNILLYIPLGYLLPELFRKLTSKQVLLISFFATFCTELTQLIFKLGWCETDDLIHNMLGAVIGLAIHRWQEKMGILKTQNQE